MNITKQIDEGSYNIYLSGEFLFKDNVEFRHVLEEIPQKDIRKVFFHMNDISFINSSALGMLLLALDISKENEKPMRILGAKGQVEKMLTVAKLHLYFLKEDENS